MTQTDTTQARIPTALYDRALELRATLEQQNPELGSLSNQLTIAILLRRGMDAVESELPALCRACDMLSVPMDEAPCDRCEARETKP